MRGRSDYRDVVQILPQPYTGWMFIGIYLINIYNYHSDENTGIDMLYKGIELSNAEFVINKDLLMFQEFAKDLDVNLLKILF